MYDPLRRPELAFAIQSYEQRLINQAFNERCYANVNFLKHSLKLGLFFGTLVPFARNPNPTLPDPMDSPKKLGSGLRSAREARNLSLRQVEEATGISNAYLSQLENEKVKKPSPHFLHKLAALYDVPYELLMEYAGYIMRAPGDSDAPRTLAAAALRSQAHLSKAGAAMYSQAQLTDDEVAQLLDYLGYLRSKQKTK